jgi:hypothetical protein
VRDLEWTADATVEGAGRFLLRLDDRHWYALVLHDGRARVEARIGDLHREIAEVAVAGEIAVLRIECVPPASAPVPFGHAGPDDVILSVHDGTGFRELARLDGRYLSTEVASGFTGRMLALASTDSGGRVLSIEYVPRS